MSSKIKATVCIPTFNGGPFVESLLEAATTQTPPFEYEILVIDSGSTDDTLDIIKKFPKVKLHKIPNKDFGHGKTRNLAAKMAKGEFVVYLSQDATPASPKWLEYMIEPFNLSKKVFCVVGKQIPRPQCDATTKREVSSVFESLGPDHSLMVHRGFSLASGAPFDLRLTFFSDVNSAVRRSYILDEIPYEDVHYSEDQLLGKAVLEAGYLKVYSPSGAVWHSNEYKLNQYFKRRFDEFRAMYDVMGVKPEGRILSLFKLFVLETLRDYIFIIHDKDYSIKRKILNFFYSPVRNFLKLRASRIVSKGPSPKHIEKFSLEKQKKT